MSRIQKALAKVMLARGETSKSGGSRERIQRRRLDVSPDAKNYAALRLENVAHQVLVAPKKALQKNRIIAGLDDPRAVGIDDYKMLRTKTLRRLGTNNWRMLAITSTKQSEGKTLTALNLGISISRDRNYDVIVVDSDLRSPSVSRYLGIQPKKGLSDYLEGKASLKEILVKPGIEGFAVIPNLQAIENSSEALMSARMGQLVDELSALNSAVIVLFDLPPLVVDDALAFAPLVDAMMLVFKVGVTNREDAAAAREMTSELPVVGCVVNGDKGSGDGAYY